MTTVARIAPALREEAPVAFALLLVLAAALFL